MKLVKFFIQNVLVTLVATPTLAVTEVNLHQEIYSESSFYQKYNVVTESRLRTYFKSVTDSSWSLEPYLGVSLQYQSEGAEAKFFDNTVAPALGVRMRFGNIFSVAAQGGVRTAISKSENDNKTEWDPRVVASAGNFWNWMSLSLPNLFTEVYGEAAFVPRLSGTPVSVAWLKQGYRFKPLSSINIDPYVEVFARESRSKDLGPSLTQVRGGVRVQWISKTWSVATLTYHNLRPQKESSSVEGLFVIGGNF